MELKKVNIKDSAYDAVLDLRSFLKAFTKSWWIIILACIIAVVMVWGVFRMTFVPEYDSTATLYILKQANESVTDANVASDLTMALDIVKDCTYLIKSHVVLDRTIDDLGLGISYSDLYNSISTANPTGTRVLEITVTSASPEQAKMIVDYLCSLAAVQIEDVMGFKQVNFYESGTLSSSPSNTVPLSAYLLAVLFTAGVTYLISYVKVMLDDRICTEEDVEKQLGLTVLGNIPNSNKTRDSYGYYQKAYQKSRKAVK